MERRLAFHTGGGWEFALVIWHWHLGTNRCQGQTGMSLQRQFNFFNKLNGKFIINYKSAYKVIMDNGLWKGCGRVLKPCQVFRLNSVSDNEKLKILLKQKVTRIKLRSKVLLPQGQMTQRWTACKIHNYSRVCVHAHVYMHICMIMNVCVHAHVSLSRERKKNLDSKASTLVPQRLIYFSVYWCCYGDAKNHLGG